MQRDKRLRRDARRGQPRRERTNGALESRRRQPRGAVLHGEPIGRRGGGRGHRQMHGRPTAVIHLRPLKILRDEPPLRRAQQVRLVERRVRVREHRVEQRRELLRQPRDRTAVAHRAGIVVDIRAQRAAGPDEHRELQQRRLARRRHIDDAQQRVVRPPRVEHFDLERREARLVGRDEMMTQIGRRRARVGRRFREAGERAVRRAQRGRQRKRHGRGERAERRGELVERPTVGNDRHRQRVAARQSVQQHRPDGAQQIGRRHAEARAKRADARAGIRGQRARVPRRAVRGRARGAQRRQRGPRPVRGLQRAVGPAPRALLGEQIVLPLREIEELQRRLAVGIGTRAVAGEPRGERGAEVQHRRSVGAQRRQRQHEARCVHRRVQRRRTRVGHVGRVRRAGHVGRACAVEPQARAVRRGLQRQAHLRQSREARAQDLVAADQRVQRGLERRTRRRRGRPRKACDHPLRGRQPPRVRQGPHTLLHGRQPEAVQRGLARRAHARRSRSAAISRASSSTASPIAASTRRSPVNGARPCAISMLSAIRKSPFLHGNATVSRAYASRR